MLVEEKKPQKWWRLYILSVRREWLARKKLNLVTPEMLLEVVSCNDRTSYLFFKWTYFGKINLGTSFLWNVEKMQMLVSGGVQNDRMVGSSS